jgi:predicted CopG family antitoxin
MTTVSINDEIYNGLKLEAEKQHRSISSLIEWIVLKCTNPRITKLSDEQLEKEMKMVDISA